MRIVRHAEELETDGCVLVPTMGFLHAGHAALIEQGAGAARDRGIGAGCVVSIFVNPTQFNDQGDFDKYPRDEAHDLAVCEAAGAGVCWFASVEDVYPPGVDVPVEPMPSVATRPGLEDAGRPGHFQGVVQVVRRLWEMSGASASVFGEKDWQQLRVAQAMSDEEGLGVEILPGPIARDPDGLAMSSRNVHLSPAARASALSLHRSIEAAQRESTPEAGEAAMRRVLTEAGVTIDYAVIRDAHTLLAPTQATRAWRAITTCIVGGDGTPGGGGTRLLDNGPWRPGGDRHDAG
ncbi:MAG: 4-phosphopantoate--beta-alanine ligase [Phycisphaerales bacterium JB040]